MKKQSLGFKLISGGIMAVLVPVLAVGLYSFSRFSVEGGGSFQTWEQGISEEGSSGEEESPAGRRADGSASDGGV